VRWFAKFLLRLRSRFSSWTRSSSDGRPLTTRAQPRPDPLLERAAIDLNRVVSRMMPELERVLGEGIEVRATLAFRPVVVLSNAAAIEHMLLSVALNARDVMRDGGRVTIETIRVDPGDDPMHFRPPSTARGCLVVSNTAIGSFGLASVAYTANQLDGRLLLESRPGAGTRISFEFPLVNET
jgi:signal transduction histidine kinase